jgi:8-oxo-dGTP pyrophosphatase MutT (NUDIX family)
MADRPSPDEVRRRVLEDRPSFEPVVTANPVPPRDAATVILVRDGPEGVEVLMLERHVASDFAAGAYVFPGGTLDERDLDPAAAAVLDGPSAEEAAALLDAPPERAIGLLLCAVRETFEEAGVLLARRDGRPLAPSPAEVARLAEHRRALAAGRASLADVAAAEGIRYAGDLLLYWARWITPELSPRRYDARFFVARMPEGQEPLHDDVETTASTWIAPSRALERAREGLFSVVFPTRKTLEGLSAFGRAADVVAAAADRRVQPVLPKVVLADGAVRVVLPGDPTLHEP